MYLGIRSQWSGSEIIWGDMSEASIWGEVQVNSNSRERIRRLGGGNFCTTESTLVTSFAPPTAWEHFQNLDPTCCNYRLILSSKCMRIWLCVQCTQHPHCAYCVDMWISFLIAWHALTKIYNLIDVNICIFEERFTWIRNAPPDFDLRIHWYLRSFTYLMSTIHRDHNSKVILVFSL